MFIEPKYEEIVCKNQIKTLISETNAECKTALGADEVAKILGVSAHAVLTGEEVTAGQFRYGGRIVFCIAYLSPEGVVKKAECGAEFSNAVKIDPAEGKLTSRTALSVTRAAAEISGGILVARGVVAAETCFYAERSVKALTGGENLIVKKCAAKSVKETKFSPAVYPLEEEFELNYPVGDAVMHSAKAIVTAAQCGVGTVICDGELILSVCFLQKIENSDILKETKVFPFRVEAEAEDALPAFAADCEVALKGLSVDINVDEAAGKSTVRVSAEISLTGSYFEETDAEYATDCYSPLCEVRFSKTEIAAAYPSGEKTLEKRVSGRGAFLNGLEAGARLMCCADEKITLTSVTATDTIAAEGVLEATAFCKDIEGKVFSVALEAPFSAVLECDVGDDRYRVDAAVCECGARIASLESFDIDALVKFRVRTERRESVFAAGEVEEGEEKKPSGAALSVYIPVEGEELWDAAKRLNASPEEISAMNPDLSFPLEGNERIVIYRQEKKEY